MLARGDTQLLTARRATFRAVTSPATRLLLQLQDGELHLTDDHGNLTRVRFGSMRQSLDLERVVQRHFGFLGQHAGSGSGAAAATLALGLLATVVGLGIRRRVVMAITGLGATVAVQIACWTVGGFVPLVVAGGGVGWLLWVSRRGATRPGD